MVFLVFLSAVLRAVDKYANLLRASVATPGNDHRLGANEAPPAIVSIFLGDQLTDILQQLVKGSAKSSKQGGQLQLGVSTLPELPKDTTDRNRTSPFAFTGNKFEFRMVGSSQSTSGPMFVLNTIVADVLSEIADELEKSKNVPAAAQAILQRIAREHGRIVYNGDNYTADWVAEAEKRGLPNLRSTVESLDTLLTKDNINVFKKHGVLSKNELHARHEILLEIYNKTVRIEALTMLNMAKRLILPAAVEYSGTLAGTTEAVKAAGASSDAHSEMLTELCRAIGALRSNVLKLESAVAKVRAISDVAKQAAEYHGGVVPAMNAVREAADKLETIVDDQLWPLPTYAEMLFYR
jgi:glutamine synthetase